MIKSDFNKDLVYAFLELDAGHKKLLYKQLSPEFRMTLINVIMGGNTKLSDSQKTTLFKAIEDTKGKSLNLTRISDKASAIHSIAEYSHNVVRDDIPYSFKVLTADKTNALVNQILVHKTRQNNLPIATQEDVEKLLQLAKSSGQALEFLLKKHNFSTELIGINFKKIDATSHTGENLQGINFNNITFNNCNFYWSTFSGSSLKNTRFINCEVSNVSFMNSKLEDCTFDNCNMREVMFTGAELKSVVFNFSSLICNSFEDANLDKCLFSGSSTPGTHFLQADIEKVVFAKCNVRDTVFFDTFDKVKMDESTLETAEVTRPVTTILVSPEGRMISTPKAFMKLDQKAQSIPLRITLQDQKVTKDGVNSEVEKALNNLVLDPNIPIAKQLITIFIENRKDNPNVDHILRKAEKLATLVNSFFLPGGEDIPPALYGAKEDPATKWGNDYRRSILEIAIIHHSAEKGIPLMGVCRGFQMANIYYGAQLAQDIPGQLNKVQQLKLDPEVSSGLLNSVLTNTSIGSHVSQKRKDHILGGSAHHQAIQKGRGEAKTHLETAITYQGLVKAVQPKEGGSSPMILVQFHPEFFNSPTADSMEREFVDFGMKVMLSSNNEDFWEIFRDNGIAHRAKIEAGKEIKEGKFKLKAQARIVDEKQPIADYLNRKEKVLAEVLRDSNSIMNYLGSNAKIAEPDYSDKKEALINALMNDAKFILKLIQSQQDQNVLALLKHVKGEDSHLAADFQTALQKFKDAH